MRTFILNLVVLIFAGLSISRCSLGPKDVTAEIRKANEEFTAAFNSQDAEALTDVYTSDGTLYPPNSDVVQGSQDIEAFWQAVFDAGISKGELETIAAQASGNMATEDGRFKLYVGDQMVDHGKYIVIWHKVNGKWKYHRDIWSSSMTKPDNIAVVQGIYDAFAKGDIPAVLSGLDEQVVWNEAENFPYADGNPYIGHDAVLNGVFARIGAEWEYWNLIDMKIHDMDGNMVLATGRYNAKNKKSGKKINAQFGHLWTLNDRKATSFQQFADTKQVAAAMR